MTETHTDIKTQYDLIMEESHTKFPTLVVPLEGKEITFHNKGREVPTRSDPQVRMIIEQRISWKQADAELHQYKFFLGPMLHVYGFEPVNGHFQLDVQWVEKGYGDHVVTTHDEEGYCYLYENGLVSSHRFNGLAVCVLPITLDDQIVYGRVDRTAVFGNTTENIFGGNFQTNALTMKAVIEMAQSELEEETGYFLTAEHFCPLILANSMGFKANASVILEARLPVTSGELDQHFFPRRRDCDEFSELIAVPKAGSYPNCPPGVTRSWGLDVTLKHCFKQPYN